MSPFTWQSNRAIPLNFTPNSASLHPKFWRQCTEELSFQDHLQELEGAWGWASGVCRLGSYTRGRRSEAQGSRRTWSEAAKLSKDRASRLPSGLLWGRRPTGGEVPHPEAFSSLNLFCFSVFSLLFQTCLFLLKTSQLLHPSICLQDHREARRGSAGLGNSPEPIRTTTASGFLLGSLKEGGISLCSSISL